MQAIGVMAGFVFLALLVLAFCVPLTACLLYFPVLRLRPGSRHAGSVLERQRHAFKWFARRAVVVVLCLYPLSLLFQYLAAVQNGYMRAWQVGFIAFFFSDVVLLVLIALCGAYLGYAVATLPFPLWPRREG